MLEDDKKSELKLMIGFLYVPNITFSWICVSFLLFLAFCSCLRSRCRCPTAPSPSPSASPTTRPAGACPSWMCTDKSTPSYGVPCQQHKLSKYQAGLAFHIMSKPVSFRFKILLESVQLG